MTTTEHAAGQAAGSPAPRALAGVPAGTAVLLATARGDGDAPAAAMPWEPGTAVLRRLVEQLVTLGITELHVITRPQWVDAVRDALGGVRGTVQACEDIADDLRTIAAIARMDEGAIVVGHGDLVTQREALAGVLADPRLRTAVLTTVLAYGRPYVARMRTNGGQVVSAASPYHSVRRRDSAFLGVLKVDAPDRSTLADVAERLAGLTDDGVPEAWQQELDRKAGRWRVYLSRRAVWRARKAGGEDAGEQPEEDENELEEMAPGDESIVLSTEDEGELERRLDAAPQDVAALLLTGLVRSNVRVGNSFLRALFWSRPLSAAEVARAREEIKQFDEDRALLNAAVKSNDGFFTTYFVSPYSKYIARWAAHRGLTPNAVTTVSMLLGLLAAAGFATGDRAGMIAGAVLLQIAFTFDCVDGQLARYTRTFSKLGAWLDSVFDRSKEYVVFAGLAIGSGESVWLLAAAALALQTVRHELAFSYAAARHQVIGTVRHPPLDQPSDRVGPARPAAAPAPAPATRSTPALWRLLDGSPRILWVKKIIAFPIGERFAAISLTAAIWDAHTAFVVLLAWGLFALVYTLVGRVARSVI